MMPESNCITLNERKKKMKNFSLNIWYISWVFLHKYAITARHSSTNKLHPYLPPLSQFSSSMHNDTRLVEGGLTHRKHSARVLKHQGIAFLQTLLQQFVSMGNTWETNDKKWCIPWVTKFRNSIEFSIFFLHFIFLLNSSREPSLLYWNVACRSSCPI